MLRALTNLIETLNNHACILGCVLVALAAVAVILLAVDNRRRKKKRLNDVEMQRLYTETEEDLRRARAEIKHLKADLFAAREDGKIAVAKKDEEIKQLKATIRQLETDKKQLSKWGTEK